VNLFKRIEVILLLLLAVGGAVWVLSGSSNGDVYDLDPQVKVGGESAENRVQRCTLERDHGNARLDLEFRFQNQKTRKLTLQPPQVRLMTAAGKEVAPFFLPFEPQPEIAAGGSQDVRLRYWLEKSDLQGALILEVQSEKLDVKSAAPFDLEKLKNKEPRSFTDTHWTP
jgi:hypothetical protein